MLKIKNLIPDESCHIARERTVCILGWADIAMVD